MLTTEELSKILRCSMPMVRKLYEEKDFPVIRIGKNYRTNKSAFIEWSKKRHI